MNARKFEFALRRSTANECLSISERTAGAKREETSISVEMHKELMCGGTQTYLGVHALVQLSTMGDGGGVTA